MEKQSNTNKHPWSIRATHRHLKNQKARSRPCLLPLSLGVSTRTLFRGIALLRERGLLLTAGTKARGGVYSFTEAWGVGRYLENKRWWFVAQALALQRVMNSHLFMTSLSSIKHKLMAFVLRSTKDKLRHLKTNVFILGWKSVQSPHVASVLQWQSQGSKEETQSPLYSAFFVVLKWFHEYKELPQR